MSNVQRINTSQLRKNIDKNFDLGEIKLLCFELEIDYEVFGTKKKEITIDLVTYCQRHGRLPELIAYCRKGRPHVEWSQNIEPEKASLETVETRQNHRRQIYEQSRNVQIVHTIEPSAHKRDWWEITIYLIHHKSEDLSIIDAAEFYFGVYWNNEIFRVSSQDDFIGVMTLAKGPFMCTCRVLFKDGKEVMLNRYIDFEMAKPLTQEAVVDSKQAEMLSGSRMKLLKQIEAELNLNELGYIISKMGMNYDELSQEVPHTDYKGHSGIDVNNMIMNLINQSIQQDCLDELLVNPVCKFRG